MRELNCDSIQNISNLVDSSDISNLVISCTLFYKAIQPGRIKQKITNSFIKSVAQGKLSEIDKFNPLSCISLGTITDYSHRTFINISPFQYALWAWDLRGAVQLMLESVINIKDNNFFQILLNQYHQVKNGYIQYTLDGKNHSEKHYNFEPLLEKMSQHIKNYELWSSKKLASNWEEITEIQRLLPAHVAQYYCDQSESNAGNINTNYKETRSLQYYNHRTNKNAFWYPQNELEKKQNKLGIVRGKLQLPSIWTGKDGSIKNLEQDYINLSHLFQSQVQTFLSLEESLNEMINKDSNRCSIVAA